VANTYTQIYIPIVFAVQGRQNLIGREYNDELQKYMTGIVSGKAKTSTICQIIFTSLSARGRTSPFLIWFAGRGHLPTALSPSHEFGKFVRKSR
jgi:hypothetical protein